MNVYPLWCTSGTQKMLNASYNQKINLKIDLTKHYIFPCHSKIKNVVYYTALFKYAHALPFCNSNRKYTEKNLPQICSQKGKDIHVYFTNK